jgi:hypothetical protein
MTLDGIIKSVEFYGLLSGMTVATAGAIYGGFYTMATAYDSVKEYLVKRKHASKNPEKSFKKIFTERLKSGQAVIDYSIF